jgi:hypothetical protein
MLWLTDKQMLRSRPFVPKSHGKLRVDDRRVPSGFIIVNLTACLGRMRPRTTVLQ